MLPDPRPVTAGRGGKEPMKLSFCLHNHQPVGNFPDVFRTAFRNCYLPMLSVLERHPGVRIGLHLSGPLLEWLEAEEPGYLEKLAALCREARVELLTSGRYEPVLTVFPRTDIVEQIRDFSQHITGISGREPTGLWLTERVWEPGLASVLAAAEVTYAVVDDVHLRRAGVPADRLHGPWITEDSGRRVILLAGSREMRYLVPFRPVEEVAGWLRQMDEAGTRLVFYGDDGEKFGVWPGTGDLCYRDGWLDRFFSMLESSDWLEMVLPCEAAALPAMGPVYVPAASYTEMSEWTLDADAAKGYRRAREAVAAVLSGEEADALVTGGFWRNFLSLYPESGELHGRVLSAAGTVSRSGSREALHHLWRSQCNCAYWHGVFGGIYLPHLREAVWKELQKAEHLALDALDAFPRVVSADLNADGREELLVISRCMSVLAHPERGVAVSELSLLTGEGEPIPVGHVLTRQRETYHDSIPDSCRGAGEALSIHDARPAREDGLSEKLVVDGWRRMAFTDLLLPSDAVPDDYARGARFIRSFQEAAVSDLEIVRTRSAVTVSARLLMQDASVSRRLLISTEGARLDARAEYSSPPGVRVGMEVCLNMMTGDSPDRFLRIDGGGELLLGSTGAFRASKAEVIDRWRGVRVRIEADHPVDVWFTPIESVSMSESGFERVHQGSALLFSEQVGASGVCVMNLGLELDRP
jgi:4-alpha-glucanotransferase